MKYLCTHCEKVYGDGPQTNSKKMQRGFCSECWDWLLSYMKFHWQQMLLEERRKVEPKKTDWMFNDPDGDR